MYAMTSSSRGSGGGRRGFITQIQFLLSSLDFCTLVTFIYGDASAPLTGFLLLRMAPIAKEGPKIEVMDFLVVELSCTGFVCRMRRVLPPCIQGPVRVQ